MSPGIQEVEALDEGHFVCVEWEDGNESSYPWVWLRDNCQCPLCFLPSAGARRLPFEDLDMNIVVKQVQFLHCIKQRAAGGESEVVDGFHVSNELKKHSPEAYQILSSTAIDYTDVGVDYCDFAVHCKQRIIDMDSRGQEICINCNNATRDTVFDIPAEKVRVFYAALKEFNNLLDSAEHKFTYKLKPGQ